MFRFASLPPLSLYIHLPWCMRKCPYCDFNSHAAAMPVPEAEYIEALLRDLEQDLPRVRGRTVQTVFLGGGTPSLFSPGSVDKLLTGVRERVVLAPGAEITLEANPGTVELARFRGYAAAGVNRLSIGVQSFDPEKLAALGRIHGRDEALAATQAARQAGFDNFNLDLMFGLPQQTVAQAIADIDTAMAQQPAHISLYQLTIEPNTLFHAQPPALPDEETIWTMQQELQARMARSGYRQYEVSAYAAGARECQHNLNYWRFGDYLGIGAGAHAKITDATAIARLRKPAHPREYLSGAGTPAGVAEEQPLTQHNAAAEFMLNALRLRDGFAPALFEERTGLPIDVIDAALAEARKKSLLRVERERIQPTETGYRYLDDLITLFL
jgi:putative oxygen-independent coproporphyrinogen III oxidase